MGILLQAQVYDVVGLEYTELSAAASASGTTLTVDSTEGFSANDYIIVGELNKEKTEIVKISSVDTSTQLTVSALTYAHSIDDPIRYTPYNQVKFYRSTSESGTYTLIGTETMEVDNSSGLTLYNDTAGTTSSWYKFTYYNSNSSVETAIADSVAVSGGYTLYCTVEDVYRILGFRYDEEDRPRESFILPFIEARTKQFDKDTGTVFISTSIGSTSDYVYVDGKGDYVDYYPLGYAPVISITAIQTTQTTPSSTATWDTLTAGRDNDYILYEDEGAVRLVNTQYFPPEEPDALRWYGTYGHDPTPDDVKVAVAKGVAMDLVKSNQHKTLIKGTEGFEEAQLGTWQTDWDKAVEHYKVDKIEMI